LKNSGPLGTHAAVYGLSSLCVTLHPAQSVTTILQHSPSAVPARQTRAARSPSRSYRAQRSLAHRFACRPSRSSRLTRALWAPIAQRREGPKTKGRVPWLCMWARAQPAFLRRSAKMRSSSAGMASLVSWSSTLAVATSPLMVVSRALAFACAAQRAMGTQRHSAALSVTQRHSASLSVSDPKGTPKQHPPAARPRRSCKSP